MKGIISIFITIALFLTPCALTILAQTDERPAQILLINEAGIKPSMISEREAISKEVLTLLIKHNFAFSIYTFSTEDFHNYYVYPLKNYADMDKLGKSRLELVKKVGETKFMALMKRSHSTFEYSRWFLLRFRPDLFFTPENPRLQPKERNFFLLDILFLQPGKENEFEEILKEFLALCKSKSISEEFKIFAGDLGLNVPVYIISLFAKNASDSWSRIEKMWELLGKEGGVLYRKMMPLVRKREFKQGWFRPDLSYIIEEK